MIANKNRCSVLRPAVFQLTLLLLLALSAKLQGENSLTIGPTVTEPNSTTVVPVMASHDLDIHGFSLALVLPSAVTVTGIDYTGTAVGSALGGGDPDFSELSQNGNQVTVGVIFSLMPTTPVGIPATPTIPGNLIARLEVDVSPTAIPGDYTVQLQDGLGTPPVNNAFTSAGQTLLPSLSSGSFTINNPFLFRVRSTEANPGETVDLIIESDNDAALDGFVISILYDNSSMTRVSLFSGIASCVNPVDYSPLITCLDLGNALGSQTIENVTVVEQTNVVPGRNFVTFGVVIDGCPPFAGQQLPTGVDQSLMRIRFNISPGATVGNSANISFTNDYPLASPIENLAIFNGGNGVTPILVDGSIGFGTTPPAGILFKRGDASGDGGVGLPDAITILNYLFLGGLPPGCLDTADTNDDGVVGLQDVIALLNFLFVGGCPLADPGSSCGVDAIDTDTLGCQVYSACPVP